MSLSEIAIDQRLDQLSSEGQKSAPQDVSISTCFPRRHKLPGRIRRSHASGFYACCSCSLALFLSCIAARRTKDWKHFPPDCRCETHSGTMRADRSSALSEYFTTLQPSSRAGFVGDKVWPEQRGEDAFLRYDLEPVHVEDVSGKKQEGNWV